MPGSQKATMPKRIKKTAAVPLPPTTGPIPEVRQEEALLKAGALQRAIFNSANFSSIATDAKGVIQIFNVGAERMLGYEAADVVNKITPADISDPQELIARAETLSVELEASIAPGFEALVFKASRGIEDIYELTYIRKDGSRFPAVVSVTALRDAPGTIIGYLLIGTDNTARKRAEEALLKAGALQSAIFNSANFSSIATDAKGVIQIFNVGAERMLGYEAADVMNKITPADISDPQELIVRAKTLSVELEASIAPGFEALVFKASRGIEDIYELTYIRKDGSRFPAVVSVTALRDAPGTIIGYLLIGTDNTARKQIEAEQRQLGQRFRDQQFYTRSLFEANMDALMTTDAPGIITDVNKQMEELTGCTRDELIGAPFKDYFTDPARAETAIGLVLSQKKLTNYELTARDRNGKETVVSYNATTFYDRDRKLQGVFAAARDITERKQHEESLREATYKAQEANRAKSDFLANMSHEVRTPMNAIMGMTHLALRANPTPEQRDYLTKIASGAESLLNIINDILDFSKIEAGKLELEHIPFSLDELLNKLDDVIGQTAIQKGIGLVFLRDPNAPRSLVGDPLRLGQILINLVNNAVKFTNDGEVIVKVKAADAVGDAGRLSFSICDSGIGMSAEQISNLFQSFTQADTSTTRKYGGTGLGLAITKHLCELMGGTLSVESVHGKGSTFTFSATFGVAPESASSLASASVLKEPSAPVSVVKQLEEPLSRSTPPSSILARINFTQNTKLIDTPNGDCARLIGRRVLLVEDNYINRRVAAELLIDLGIQVTSVVNGREAMDRIEAEPFDLVLMDIQMPVMDGLTATKLVRANERFHSLPIIAMTAHAMSGDRERSLFAGMSDHLTKPINPERLTAALTRWMPTELAVRPKDQISAPEPALVDKDGVPGQLLPFDIQAALVRINGKPSLLRELLFNFRDQYQNAALSLLELVRKGKTDEAERLAHSLKSVAATLEARDLAESAFAIEEALRAGRTGDLVSLITAMEEALDPAIIAVSSLVQAQARPSPVDKQDGVKDSSSDRCPCVLIVDDESSDLALLRDTFSSGYEVLVATDGLTALRIAETKVPDVVLLDVLMAGIDGYEVCRRLKATTRTSGIPIIFITGYGDAEAETKGLKLGAVDFVTKPIKPAAVKARVDNQILLQRAKGKLALTAAKELATSYARFASLLESMSDSVITIGRDWTLLYANSKAMESLPELTVGANYWSCFPALAGSTGEQLQRDAMESRSEVNYELFYPPSNQWFRAKAFPVDEGISVFFSNITQQKEIQHQLGLEQLLREKRIEALAHMAGGLSHEINNPLGIIRGRARNLLDLASGEEPVPALDVRKACESIVQTSDRATRILRSLRGFGRESRTDPMELLPIAQIIEHNVELQEVRFLSSDLELKLVIDPDLPLVLCREAEIGQILTNLLDNAFDAITQAHSVVRRVSVTATHFDNEVRIDVSDSGPGIEDYFRPHLMEPFFSTKELGLGMGVGLSLSRAIAQNHGGTLSLVEGAQDTRFRLVLPIPVGSLNPEAKDLLCEVSL
jgi:PAS domain S-box-containing protein